VYINPNCKATLFLKDKAAKSASIPAPSSLSLTRRGGKKSARFCRPTFIRRSQRQTPIVEALEKWRLSQVAIVYHRTNERRTKIFSPSFSTAEMANWHDRRVIN
jgi:hypothetical protein